MAQCAMASHALCFLNLLRVQPCAGCSPHTKSHTVPSQEVAFLESGASSLRGAEQKAGMEFSFSWTVLKTCSVLLTSALTPSTGCQAVPFQTHRVPPPPTATESPQPQARSVRGL